MKIEVCVGSPEAIDALSAYRFDRIELCQNLEHGGLTPDAFLYEKARKQLNCEIHVLIRCRVGDFVYSESEIAWMCNQIKYFKKLGADGFVIGALTQVNGLDFSALDVLLQSCGETPVTFHRAFDSIQNKKEALSSLVERKFQRVLTNGGGETIEEGLIMLEALSEFSAGKIEIMAGGGVNPNNIEQLLQSTVDAIHFSACSVKKAEISLPFSEDLLQFEKEKAKLLFDKIDFYRK